MAAADVTDEVWDHVLLGAPAPRECALPAGLLARMRREFSFWYPFDLRVRRPRPCQGKGCWAVCRGVPVLVPLGPAGVPTRGSQGEGNAAAHEHAVVNASMLCVRLGCPLEHAVCAMHAGYSTGASRWCTHVHFAHV